MQGNDSDKKMRDRRAVNAGRTYALRTAEMLQRTIGEGMFIISPPDGLNGADDVVLAGYIHKWMESFKLEPIKRTKGA